MEIIFLTRKIQKNSAINDSRLNKKLLEDLLKNMVNYDIKYTLHMDEDVFPLSDVKILKSSNPVSSPTLRGGIYISDKYDYKISGIIDDISVIPMLSKTMLGPNTNFKELKVVGNSDSNSKNIQIFAFLTNSMQKSSQIHLNMSITRIESD